MPKMVRFHLCWAQKSSEITIVGLNRLPFLLLWISLDSFESLLTIFGFTEDSKTALCTLGQ